MYIRPDDTQPMFRQNLESRRQSVQPIGKCLIAGQLWKPLQQMIFGIVVYRLLLKSPLANAPKIYRYTLLVAELGTEIVALTLRYGFDCATIVTNSAKEQRM